MSDKRTIVLVGHCIADRFMLKSAVSRAVSGATIDTVNSADDLQKYLNADFVLLVNRALDGRFESDSGIDLIRTASQGDNAPISILISNYEESQQEAVAAGAAGGFGKSQLYDDETVRVLKDAVG